MAVSPIVNARTGTDCIMSETTPNIPQETAKRNKIIYWVSTGLLCLLMFGSAMMYFFMYDPNVFVDLGYPPYLIYPLAVAKLLGITAILTRRSELLKEWAYAGFFYDVCLALAAHIAVQDGEYIPAALGLVFVITSRAYEGTVFHADPSEG